MALAYPRKELLLLWMHVNICQGRQEEKGRKGGLGSTSAMRPSSNPCNLSKNRTPLSFPLSTLVFSITTEEVLFFLSLSSLFFVL
jgi:hypothetical protein